MPSRKRAKGRERKLKQQAREPVERSVSQPPLNGGNIDLPEQSIRRMGHSGNVWCDHGCLTHKIVPGHPVRDFIDSFREPAKESLEMTFEKHQKVWKDSTLRKMAIDTMVSIGTNLIIDKNIETARMSSDVIILLEHYDGEGIFPLLLYKGTWDIGYIRGAEERDVIHFYKKRIPCSCLDELYSEIKKSQVRGSLCCHCKQTIKRKDLKTCSRCKCVKYCSKECQISDWPSHKELCERLCSNHKDLKKAETTERNERVSDL